MNIGNDLSLTRLTPPHHDAKRKYKSQNWVLKLLRISLLRQFNFFPLQFGMLYFPLVDRYADKVLNIQNLRILALNLEISRSGEKGGKEVLKMLIFLFQVAKHNMKKLLMYYFV